MARLRVGDRLGLDALGGVDDKDRALRSAAKRPRMTS